MFQKTKYIHEDGKFRPLEFPISYAFSYYLTQKGYETDMEVEAAKQLYGRNRWSVNCSKICIYIEWNFF